MRFEGLCNRLVHLFPLPVAQCFKEFGLITDLVAIGTNPQSFDTAVASTPVIWLTALGPLRPLTFRQDTNEGFKRISSAIFEWVDFSEIYQSLALSGRRDLDNAQR